MLREVVIESDASGAIARLALKKYASVDVKQMVLDNPPRIVLDLIPRTALARAPVTVTAKQGPARELAKAEPAPQQAPKPVPALAAETAAEVATAPEAEAETAPATAEPVAEAAPKAEAAEREAAPDAAGDELDARAARDAAAQAELDRLAGVVPMAEPAPRPAEEPAAEEAAGEPDSGAAGEAEAPKEASGEKATEPAAGFDEGGEGYDADAMEVAAMPSATRVPARGPLGFMPAPFDDPLVLGVVVVLLGVVGALVVVRQRSARLAGAEASANPFAAADAFALAGAGAPGGSREAAEAWASGAPPDAAMGPLFANAAQPSAEVPAASIFDVAEDDAGRYEECTPPASSLVVVDSEEAAQGAASYQPEALEENVMRVVEELERRIAHLETRLEEVADAKERLERHVAAQTEELRVQRAAIARTQRVLRTIAKPDDLATEPTPKV